MYAPVVREVVDVETITVVWTWLFVIRILKLYGPFVSFIIYGLVTTIVVDKFMDAIRVCFKWFLRF